MMDEQTGNHPTVNPPFVIDSGLQLEAATSFASKESLSDDLGCINSPPP